MKKIIQLILFSFVIVISIVFYQVYFGKTNQATDITETPKDELIEPSKNNLIKNLKYEVKLDQESQYIITSELSEITYENDIEKVKMQKVIAIFIDKTNVPLTITSDKAIYNNTNYNTSFEDNVKIKYLNNIILADNMFLDFKENFISVKNNVKYNGSLGNLEADNIKINLITKKIDVFMNNNNENIVITSSK